MIRLSQKTPDAWRHLADERSTPPEVVEHDLLTLDPASGRERRSPDTATGSDSGLAAVAADPRGGAACLAVASIGDDRRAEAGLAGRPPGIVVEPIVPQESAVFGRKKQEVPKSTVIDDGNSVGAPLADVVSALRDQGHHVPDDVTPLHLLLMRWMATTWVSLPG